MDTKKVLNQLMLERGMTLPQLAEKLGLKPQSLRNKLNRNNYGVEDFIQMLDILGCDLQVMARDSGKIFY